mmetsp:Transcript_12990/g.31646  ORF Transcript_12990/g.31646 Transcript_12990/m.31646 type:complete len:134 (+) Transcript_12990:423-824(+)|eukprot:CAMPEP_0181106634 /NCGR_PEP_ID=MMETSP1071-20121207/16635_1 /TAXON_ID=35127 /ORGANISM="Thalassiosira sp., Strain NH16" /LENGTH=133 /DNA_ID=CAMNT_0023190051 /DNA_START=333 /DNA_END=734 /DNA_ORIENTATION=+
MKTTISFLALIALVLVPSPIVGHESMLADEEQPTGTNLRQRNLGFFWKDQSYYRDVYYRCCNTDPPFGSKDKNNAAWRVEGWQYEVKYPNNENKNKCRCPVRGGGKYLSKESYYEKWNKSCEPGGNLYKKAGI